MTRRTPAAVLTGMLLVSAVLLPACSGRTAGAGPGDRAGTSGPAASFQGQTLDDATVTSLQDSVTQAEALLDGLDADFRADGTGDDTDG